MEVQMLNPKYPNRFAFVEMRNGNGEDKGRVMFDVEIVQYNPKTERNKTLVKLSCALPVFNKWVATNGWLAA